MVSTRYRSSEFLNRFIGLPYKEDGYSFKGVNCIGLVALYINKRFGINIGYDGQRVTEDLSNNEQERLRQGIEKLLENGAKWITDMKQIEPDDILCFKLFSDSPDFMGVYFGEYKFLAVFHDFPSRLNRLGRFWREKFVGAIRMR